MMHNIRIFFVLSLFITSVTANAANKLYYLQGNTMGTFYNIKYVLDDIEKDNSNEIQKNIEKVLKNVNQEMSIFIQDSELSKFNNLRKTNEFITISDDFAKVMRVANEIYQATNGKFDVTVGPLVNLWGFGSKQHKDKIPSAEEIRQAKDNVGFNKLLINDNQTTMQIAKTNPNLYIDLGAIAKGFGVDKVAEYLESIKINNYLVDIGGDLRVKGKNNDNKFWTIGIEKPQFIDPLSHDDITDIISLDNLSITTSGNYRNYIKDRENKVYSHIIDPISGKSVDNNVLSVSVIDKSATRADGFSTGLFVLNAEEGMKLAESMHIPVYMIINTDKGEAIKMSSEFKKFIQK